MRKLSENNLCIDRPYINLKKLSSKTSLKRGTVNEAGFKSVYIIDQDTQNISTVKNYIREFDKGIEKITFNTDKLNEMLLVEVNCSSRGGSKFKVFLILGTIKYAIPFAPFKDVYSNCMFILQKALDGTEELSYIKDAFGNLEPEETNVDLSLTLERLARFKDKVNYKRNVYYFVMNNMAECTSKYDINNKSTTVQTSPTIKVLRYNINTRLYSIVKPPAGSSIVNLQETDIIVDLGDSKDKNNFPSVSIYTSYGYGKLLDIKNNVIPTTNILSLFANILDLGLPVLK